jgi:nucleotide-binding universal stress UspA family protein
MMFTNILLAVDGSEASLAAARRGIALARALQAKVTVLTVTPPWADYFSRELAVIIPDVIVPQADYEAKRDAVAAGILQTVVTDARAAGVEARPVHCSHRDPYRAIIDTAGSEHCDLIVLAPHHGRGIADTLAGSETMRVLTHTHIPVLIHRQH